MVYNTLIHPRPGRVPGLRELFVHTWVPLMGRKWKPLIISSLQMSPSATDAFGDRIIFIFSLSKLLCLKGLQASARVLDGRRKWNQIRYKSNKGSFFCAALSLQPPVSPLSLGLQGITIGPQLHFPGSFPIAPSGGVFSDTLDLLETRAPPFLQRSWHRPPDHGAGGGAAVVMIGSGGGRA